MLKPISDSAIKNGTVPYRESIHFSLFITFNTSRIVHRVS